MSINLGPAGPAPSNDEKTQIRSAIGAQASMTAASQAEMEAGVEAAIRSMSPLRVAQAIAALATNVPDPTALTYAGSDPNNATTLTISGITADYNGDPVVGDLVATLSADLANGKVRYYSITVGWAEGVAYDGTQWEAFIGNNSTSAFVSTDDFDTPDQAGGWVAGGSAAGSPTFVLSGAIEATHLGQWCKSTTAWWQWDGFLWIPRFTLAGDPIAYNATLSAFRKLVVSGADGSEIITASAL